MTMTMDDHGNWTDTGCAAWSRCLSCPLPACLCDRAEGLRGAYAVRRWLDAAALAAEGRTVSEIAVALGMNPRTVYRALAGVRRLGVPVRGLAEAGERAEVTR